MVPPKMRGLFYPTAYTARCAVFTECNMCHGCARYNPSELACTLCESGYKEKMGLICHHSFKQRMNAKIVCNALGPMYNLNRKGGSVSIANIDENKRLMDIADSMVEPCND